MEYSFYGGRPGKSFVIAKDFPTYKDMKIAFAQGWDYQEVGYDEYVLINTTDPRNIENGKLYRRGLEGPVYVGTIQGTPGYPPHLRIEKYGDIQEPVKDDLSTLDYIYSKSEREIESIELVPGKDGDTFNDTIEWKVLSVRAMYYRDKEGKEIANTLDNNVTEDTAARTITFTKDGITTTGAKYHERTSAEETIVKIGFKFPYHVFDWEAQSIDPYNSEYRTDLNNGYHFHSYAHYDNLIENMQESSDGKDHPFYSKLNIKVPQGIKGNSIDGLKVISIAQYNELKAKEKETIAINHPQWEEKYVGWDDDVNNTSRKILVYEFKDYKYKQEGTTITKYLADFDMVSNVEIAQDGTLTVYFTHKDPVIYSGLIGWINRIELNKEDFHLYAHYNNEDYFPDGSTVLDLGSTKIDSTLSIAFNIDSDDEGVGGIDIGNNLSYLNDVYPNGLNQDVNGDPIGTQWMRGKIVTVGPKVTDNKNGGKQKNFFAYDYNLNQWYYLGSLNRIDVGRVQQIAPHDDYSSAIDKLDDGGICFLYRERPSVINESMEE